MKWARVVRELEAQRRLWLVTGGAGFIGSHLVEQLLALGQRVRVLDDFSTGSEANLDEVRHVLGDEVWRACEVVRGDIRDPSVCANAMRSVDGVFHQAALGSVPRSIEFPRDTHGVNVDGTVNVLLAAVEADVRRVVYASSSSVYGDDPKLPKVEGAVGNPLSPYAASKKICEVYAGVFHRTYALGCVGLRYFNVVGPRQSPDGPYAAVVPRWLEALSKGERPVIYGDGETSRDFCPIGNVVRANLLAAFADEQAMGRVFNVALGRRTTLNRLFEILRDGLAERGTACGDVQPECQDFRPGDIRHSQADIRSARSLLGYEPEITVEAGLELAIEWWSDKRSLAQQGSVRG